MSILETFGMGELGNSRPVLAAGRLSQQPNRGMGHEQGGSITVLVNVSIDKPDDGINGILAKLAMISKRREQKMCYRAGLLCRGTWTGPPRSELEHRVYKGRWGKLGWFCHRKRRRRGDLCCLQLPGGRQQRRRSQTLLMVNSNRMRCNEHDLEHGKSPLDTRKNCESCEALEQGPERMWNLCPWRNLA